MRIHDAIVYVHVLDDTYTVVCRVDTDESEELGEGA